MPVVATKPLLGSGARPSRETSRLMLCSSASAMASFRESLSSGAPNWTPRVCWPDVRAHHEPGLGRNRRGAHRDRRNTSRTGNVWSSRVPPLSHRCSSTFRGDAWFQTPPRPHNSTRLLRAIHRPGQQQRKALPGRQNVNGPGAGSPGVRASRSRRRLGEPARGCAASSAVAGCGRALEHLPRRALLDDPPTAPSPPAWSQTRATSLMSWAIRSIASRPRSCSSSSRLSTWPRTEASSADTGSSRISARGPVASARASATRWRSPPESSRGEPVEEGVVRREPDLAQQELPAPAALAPGAEAVHRQGLRRRRRPRTAAGRAPPGGPGTRPGRRGASGAARRSVSDASRSSVEGHLARVGPLEAEQDAAQACSCRRPTCRPGRRISPGRSSSDTPSSATTGSPVPAPRHAAPRRRSVRTTSRAARIGGTVSCAHRAPPRRRRGSNGPAGRSPSSVSAGRAIAAALERRRAARGETAPTPPRPRARDGARARGEARRPLRSDRGAEPASGLGCTGAGVFEQLLAASPSPPSRRRRAR